MNFQGIGGLLHAPRYELKRPDILEGLEGFYPSSLLVLGLAGFVTVTILQDALGEPLWRWYALSVAGAVVQSLVAAATIVVIMLSRPNPFVI